MLDIRCVFMGTPQIAATVLSSMLEAGIKIDLVVSQPDKKVGRKQKIVYSPVKQVAVDHEIECFQPVRIKEDHQRILDLKPDLCIWTNYSRGSIECTTFWVCQSSWLYLTKISWRSPNPASYLEWR